MYLLCQGVDDLPECGEGLVDVGSLLEPCPCCPGGLRSLTACQVHQAQLAHLLCRQSCHRVHPTAAAGVGGAALGVGGAALDVGGAALGVGGAALGVGGAALGVGGAALGVGGTALGVADDQSTCYCACTETSIPLVLSLKHPW